MMMLVYYGIAVLIASYGLKCIVLQRGTYPDTQHRRGFHSRVLFTVHGAAAVSAGLGYLSLGMFWALYPGKWHPGNSLTVYIIRSVLCAASLILAFSMWQIAHNQRLGIT
jgi:hypothetical protein